MTKFDELTRKYITEVASMNDSYNHGSGFAVDVYFPPRRQGDVRSIKQQLMKELHRALIGANTGVDDKGKTSHRVQSSANVIPYKRSNESDSSVLELTVTGIENEELLRSTLGRVLDGKFKYDIYPVGQSK